jgi:hypothetical protein
VSGTNAGNSVVATLRGRGKSTVISPMIELDQIAGRPSIVNHGQISNLDLQQHVLQNRPPRHQERAS